MHFHFKFIIEVWLVLSSCRVGGAEKSKLLAPIVPHYLRNNVDNWSGNEDVGIFEVSPEIFIVIWLWIHQYLYFPEINETHKHIYIFSHVSNIKLLLHQIF